MKVYLVPENQLDKGHQVLGEYELVPATAPASGVKQSVEHEEKAIKQWWNSPKQRFYRMRYRYTIRSVIISLILAILFLTIGFARTIGVLLLITIGYLVGGVLDKNPVVLSLLRRFR